MNRIILIGNGFDLAHGLKTSYRHFIDDLCKQIKTDKEMWNVTMAIPESKKVDFEKLKEEDKEKFKNKFFYAVKKDLNIQNWVDVEKVYYKELVSCMEDAKKTPVPTYTIKELNEEFGFFEKKLKEYLSREIVEKGSSIEIKQSIENYLDKTIPEEIKTDEDAEYTSTYIVNFNYTDTDKKYAHKISEEDGDLIIRLHGELHNLKNPMIFGYGDELAKSYSEIEDLDDNRYLEYVKSIKYSLTDNYCDLYSFINSGIGYHIYLFGLSCGNSDRTLLNELFEHPNCEKIKIFYWQKDDMSDDYLDVYKNISRIFTQKNNLRNIVVTKPNSKPLVPLTDIEIFLNENFVKFNDNGHKFRISKFLVTQAQYESLMGTNPSYFKGDKLPVENVSWYDAAEFCNLLSRQFNLEERYVKKGEYLEEDTTKNGFRLPTDNEWVYAAKHCRVDNTETTNFAGTNNENRLKDYAWYRENSGGQTHEVGTATEATELKIHDMSGNVWEWCEDLCGKEGCGRVLCGGSWLSSAGNCRVSIGNGYKSNCRGYNVGFRLARSL